MCIFPSSFLVFLIMLFYCDHYTPYCYTSKISKTGQLNSFLKYPSPTFIFKNPILIKYKIQLIIYQFPPKVVLLLRKLKQQGKEQMEERRPKLIQALKQMGDFYLQLKWDFQSWGICLYAIRNEIRNEKILNFIAYRSSLSVESPSLGYLSNSQKGCKNPSRHNACRLYRYALGARRYKHRI